MEQGEDVLELVPEAECSARLIERRPREDSRGEALIEEPSIEHEIHRRLGGLDADAPENVVPEGAQAAPGGLDDGRLPKPGNERERLLATLRLP